MVGFQPSEETRGPNVRKKWPDSGEEDRGGAGLVGGGRID